MFYLSELTLFHTKGPDIQASVCVSPQSSSSESSRQSFSPLQRSSPGMQMWFRQAQSDTKQPSVAGQFSSSEPVGHWIVPSQRADALTQPTESTQGK